MNIDKLEFNSTCSKIMILILTNFDDKLLKIYGSLECPGRLSMLNVIYYILKC